MPDRSLQRTLRSADARQSPEQERFHFLIQQIEKIRRELREWEATTLTFRQERTAKLSPLQATLAALGKQTVIALDRLLDERGWSRLERSELQELLRGMAEVLLEGGSDGEVRDLFEKHSGSSFDAIKQDELQRLKEQAEAFTGLDLGEDDLRTEEDLVRRMYEQMAAREEKEKAKREQRAQRARKSASAERREDSAQLARQSLREIYRKLASALHPDREADPARREEKNALMQRINRAYATNDLLTLFEVQLQIEQIDASHISRIGAARLKQYNRLLSEQLVRVKRELADSQYAFCEDHGLDMRGLTPRRLTGLIQQQARRVRAQIDRQKRFLDVFVNKASTKRWLKQQRRIAERGLWMEDDD